MEVIKIRVGDKVSIQTHCESKTGSGATIDLKVVSLIPPILTHGASFHGNLLPEDRTPSAAYGFFIPEGKTNESQTEIEIPLEFSQRWHGECRIKANDHIS